MAAHAAAITNNDVVIVSKKRKSYMRGAQYLHMPIPMHSRNPFVVKYMLEGTADGYRNKVYGPDPRIQVSPESLVGEHFAWDIREAYDGLWRAYNSYIQDTEINPTNLEHAITLLSPDLVISSIPAPAICKNPNHLFHQQNVWATEMCRYGETTGEDNIVVCSGRPDDPWYRTSRIHGWENTEYSDGSEPPLSADKIHSVVKPISHNCDCWPDIVRVGRYGTWTKGILSHSAFYDTARLLESKVLVKEHNQ